MDNNTQNPTPPSSPPIDLAHITEEIYKKNAELAHTNKTLSILRKIDEIILSTVTNIDEIAQQVANVVTQEAEFKRISIHILDKTDNSITQTAISDVELAKYSGALQFSARSTKISMDDDKNYIVQSIKERKVLVAHELSEVIGSEVSLEDAKIMQQEMGIKSTLIYPILARGEVIGAMVISLSQNEEQLTPSEKGLIDRLAEVIGIAIDDALLYEKIQEANEKLKELDKLKDEFVSLASHELRTPMTAIKSYLFMALAGKGGILTDKQKYYIQRSYDATDRLIKLVNDMLNVSRIESGRITLDLKPQDMSKIITDVVTEITPRAQEFGIVISYTAIALPSVVGDSDKIKEVLINLVGNSLKFTPPKGLVAIQTSTDGKNVIVEVKDSGKGIRPEDMPKLFQKFSTRGTAYLVKENTKGTGLGLYISKLLIEKQNGKMWVKSEGENKGTSFYFSLPIAAPQMSVPASL